MPLQFVSCFQSPYSTQDGPAHGGTIQLTGPFGGPRRGVLVYKGARVLNIYVVHPGGLTAGIWARIWPLGAVQGSSGPQKGPSGAKTGPFRGSKNIVEAPEVFGRPQTMGGQIWTA